MFILIEGLNIVKKEMVSAPWTKMKTLFTFAFMLPQAYAALWASVPYLYFTSLDN